MYRASGPTSTAWPFQRGDLTHEYLAASSTFSMLVRVPLVAGPSTKLGSVTPSNGCSPFCSCAYLYQLCVTHSCTWSGAFRSTSSTFDRSPPSTTPEGRYMLWLL